MTGVAIALHLTRDGAPAGVEPPVLPGVLFFQFGAEGDELVEEWCLHGDEGGFSVHWALQHGEDCFSGAMERGA